MAGGDLVWIPLSLLNPGPQTAVMAMSANQAAGLDAAIGCPRVSIS
jgi:hypothetical protein